MHASHGPLCVVSDYPNDFEQDRRTTGRLLSHLDNPVFQFRWGFAPDSTPATGFLTAWSAPPSIPVLLD